MTSAYEINCSASPATCPSVYEERPLAAPICTQDINGHFPTVPCCAHDEAQRKADKTAICRHPLFPLVVLAFDKCELSMNASGQKHSTKSATGARSSRAPGTTHRDRVCTAASFNDDVRVFAQHMRLSDTVPASNPELDSLMVESIAALRSHLLEIEKVHELCDSFCNRYISCLKSKMPTEFITDDGSISSTVTSSELTSNYHQFATCSPEGAYSSDESSFESGCNVDIVSVKNDEYLRSNSSSYEPTLHRDPLHNNNVFELHSSDAGDGSIDGRLGFGFAFKTVSDNELESNANTRKQRKRSIFPKMATNILRAWLFQRTSYPYPSEDEKRLLSDQTGLTLSQVNNCNAGQWWFDDFDDSLE